MKRALTHIVIVVLVLAMSTQVWAASPVGLLPEGQEIDEKALAAIQGDGPAWKLDPGSSIIGGIAGGAAFYPIGKMLDGFGVGDWIQNKAVPAMKSAAVKTYKAVVRSMEALGEACMRSPYACAVSTW